MRAAYITQTGPAENILVGDLPDPAPTASQVLVEVTAASVNPIDTYVRSGITGAALPSPFILGSDLAGVVKAVGANVTRFAVGDRVWGANQGILGRQGTFAELAAVEERWLYETPDAVSDEAAAAMALVGITAYLGLVDEAELDAGETILVHGAGGSVGSTVVQMAKALHARVIAVTSGDEKIENVRALGADQTIDYATENIEARLKQIAPDGVNVWWETSRNVNLDLAIACLQKRGRLILMAGRAARPELPLGPFYTKCCRILGFAMFHAAPETQYRAAERINRWLTSGALRPAIDRVGALDDAAEFHRLQEENTGGASLLHGKLVVKP